MSAKQKLLSLLYVLIALLALAGDVGNSVGPGLVGFVSGGAGLNAALMVACAFPVLMLAASLYIAFEGRRK